MLFILFAHFVADFIFQTDEQAINKSKSNKWLLYHVSSYSFGILLVSFFLFSNIEIGILWVVVNAILHFGTDYITSRINSHLWQKNERHWFFVGIGADQFIHYACLLATYNFFHS